MKETIKAEPYYKLKTLIRKKGFLQKEVAEKIGMDNPTFSMKINRTGNRDFKFAEVIKIAELLDADIKEFY